MKGATFFWGEVSGVAGVSIHAPVKGATTLSVPDVRSPVVSIHAPVKGATNKCDRLLGLLGRFNPRTREGCDKRRASGNRPNDVSIHAPVKGATRLICFL